MVRCKLLINYLFTRAEHTKYSTVAMIFWEFMHYIMLYIMPKMGAHIDEVCVYICIHTKYSTVAMITVIDLQIYKLNIKFAPTSFFW